MTHPKSTKVPVHTRRDGKLGLTELIAMGVGGMIGGGIFSVLGLAVQLAGNAAPMSFLLGGMIATAAGYSYIKLALTFRDDGASFTYLLRAFPRLPRIAGIEGWTVVIGYVGTLALYAFTFGAYGAALLGKNDDALLRILLAIGVLLFFMAVNLRGARSSGTAEDLIVYAKIIILTVFGVIGLSAVQRSELTPFLEHGVSGVLLGGALIFVAFEGFQLITNAIDEMRTPERNVARGIYGSIGVTSLIYVTLALVAVGTLSESRLLAAGEYALAEVAGPILGSGGRVLVGLAALMATSSAINATVFGASHMAAVMSHQRMMPSFVGRRSEAGTPVVAVVALIALGAAFTSLGNLEVIASFSSMTFLLVSIGVSVANFRLAAETKSSRAWIVAGLALMLATVGTLIVYLGMHQPSRLLVIGAIYLVTATLGWLSSGRSGQV